MAGKLILSGGSTEKDLEFRKSEVNHLRLMLAWMRCEYMLDEDSQAGFADAARMCVEHGLTSEDEARKLLARKAEEIRHVPQYVRQAHKMLSKMLREHEKRGDVVDVEAATNRLTQEPAKLPAAR